MKEDLRTRLTQSVETALALAEGLVVVDLGRQRARPRRTSQNFACPEHGVSLPELQPRIFSFNSPHGACPRCTGPRRAAGDRPRPARARPVALDRRRRARAVGGRRLGLLRVGDPGDRRPVRDPDRRPVAGADGGAAGLLPLRHRRRQGLRPVPQPDGAPPLVHDRRSRGSSPRSSAATARPTRRRSASASRSTCRSARARCARARASSPRCSRSRSASKNIHEFTRLSITRALAVPRRARPDARPSS